MKLLILFFLIGCALALPRSYPSRYRNAAARYTRHVGLVRPRRAPARTMLIHGLYRPAYFAQRRQGFEPASAMAAFASGDNVAASSYLGSKIAPNNCCNPSAEQNTEFIGNPDALNPPQQQYDQQLGEIPQEQAPEFIPAQDQPGDDIPATEIAKPERTPKQKPNKKYKPVDDDDDDDEDAIIPSKRRGPYNSLFPIVFGGGYPGVRSNGGGSGGGVTAIANSYSTGKGGVATSHATAYGSGAPASRSSKKKKAQPQLEDEEDEE